MPTTYQPENSLDGYIKGTVLVIVGIVLLVLLFGFFYTIGAGERGVLLTFGKANSVAQEPGLHFKVPIVQSIVKFDSTTQKYEVDRATAASQDLQTVTADVTVNYYVSPESVSEIYTTIGTDYQNKIIVPAVQEVVKATTAQYTAEELITKRPEVKDKIDIAITDRLKPYFINVQSVSITNFEFSEVFNSAIENKVTAEQNALAAKNKLDQVQYEAQQRIAQAQGEAEAIKIQAAAIQVQGGKDYVSLQAISKWDGKMPLFIGQGPTPFINFPSSTLEGATA